MHRRRQLKAVVGLRNAQLARNADVVFIVKVKDDDVTVEKTKIELFTAATSAATTLAATSSVIYFMFIPHHLRRHKYKVSNSGQ
jgi:RNase P protein component